MGYEVSKGHKGHYVEITKDELEAIAIENTHTIEIDQFVLGNEIGDLYLNIPYYITPDGEVGRQAYIVIRDAMKREGVVGLGRVIFTTREHVIPIEPRDKGLLGITLRYPYEIRKERTISAIWWTRRCQSRCWSLPRISLRPKPGNSSRRTSRITTSARSAN